MDVATQTQRTVQQGLHIADFGLSAFHLPILQQKSHLGFVCFDDSANDTVVCDITAVSILYEFRIVLFDILFCVFVQIEEADFDFSVSDINSDIDNPVHSCGFK